jgi:hypothetical protein
MARRDKEHQDTSTTRRLFWLVWKRANELDQDVIVI